MLWPLWPALAAGGPIWLACHNNSLPLIPNERHFCDSYLLSNLYCNFSNRLQCFSHNKYWMWLYCDPWNQCASVSHWLHHPIILNVSCILLILTWQHSKKEYYTFPGSNKYRIIHIVASQSLMDSGSIHCQLFKTMYNYVVKTHLMCVTDLQVFVVVIPKEGWARMAMSILLLAGHWLFKNIIYDVSRVKFWKVGVIPKEGWARPRTPEIK